jgi:thiol-disulfide isomerase/thioredoxin
MNVIAANWERGRDLRREKALGKEIDKEAPDWSLPDAEGNLVALADLRGKIVVLDFWATWCGPCTVSMPMIDEFVRKHADSDVVVFSVDVWEKGKSAPLKYMRKNDFSMTLLYGNDELTQAYEVEGIPHLCVIDRNGRIRFAESGVSEELLENLIIWTESLAGGS